jgi:hypothetical protein
MREKCVYMMRMRRLAFLVVPVSWSRLLHLRALLLLITFSLEYITRFEPEDPPTIWSMLFA